MILALLAPELLLYLAINERVTAEVMLKKVLKFHSYLGKPGVLARLYNRIRGRVESKDVSAQRQAYMIHLLIYSL